MTVKERRDQILKTVNSKGYVTFDEIVKEYDISYETVRRDFEFLQSGGLIKRVFGGAVPHEKVSQGKSGSFSGDESDERKIIAAIAEKAATLIKPGDTVFLGMGMTIRALAKCLRERDDIIVVTNSLYVANELSDSSVTVFLLGGLLENDNHGIVGPMATEAMQHFYCDKMFFSCAALNRQFGVMDYGCSDPTVQQDMLKRSQKKVLVAYSSKFDESSTLCVCGIDDLDIVVTDSDIPEGYGEFLEENGVEVILADV